MTLQKLARLSRWFAGLTYLFVGLICIGWFSYVCCVEDRTKMIIVQAAIIPAGLYLAWQGIKKLTKPNERIKQCEGCGSESRGR
jgi:hypothetical protein